MFADTAVFNSMLDALNWIALVATVAAGISTYVFLAKRKWPKLATAGVAVLASFAVGIMLFVSYTAIGFPGWMRWPAQLLARATPADVFIKPGYYSINLRGWQHNTTPAGDVFTCSTCGAQVQVQLVYGPELDAEARYRTNKEFLTALGSEKAQKDFADSLIRLGIPIQSGFTISIGRVGLSTIGGLDVFEFGAIVEMPPTFSHDNSMIAIHKNRLMKLTLNYFDGAMNDRTRAAINELYSSLRFL